MPQLLALGVLALAQLFDYASFLVMIQRHGLEAEANPIVVMLAEISGLAGLTASKLLAVVFMALLLAFVLPRRRGLAIGVLTFGVAAGLIGGVTNMATI